MSRRAESRGSQSDRGRRAGARSRARSDRGTGGHSTGHAPRLLLPRASVKARRAADLRIASSKPAPAPATGSSNRTGACVSGGDVQHARGGAACLRLLRRGLRVDTAGTHEGHVRRLSSQRGSVKELARRSAGEPTRAIAARSTPRSYRGGWLAGQVDLVADPAAQPGVMQLVRAGAHVHPGGPVAARVTDPIEPFGIAVEAAAPEARPRSQRPDVRIEHESTMSRPSRMKISVDRGNGT